MQGLSCHAIPWRGDLTQALHDISSLNIKTFEAGNIQGWLQRPHDLAELISQSGVKPVSLYIGGGHVDPEDQDVTLTLVERACMFLRDHDCKYLVVGGGAPHVDEDVAESLTKIIEFLHILAMLARDHGLEMCFHPHVGTPVETADQLERFVGDTDPDLISLCIDVAHIALGGGDPSVICSRYMERIAYIHLKDLDGLGRFVELGKGTIDLHKVVRVLNESGYEGPIVIEQDYSLNPFASTQTSVQYAEGALGLHR